MASNQTIIVEDELNTKVMDNNKVRAALNSYTEYVEEKRFEESVTTSILKIAPSTLEQLQNQKKGNQMETKLTNTEELKQIMKYLLHNRTYWKQSVDSTLTMSKGMVALITNYFRSLYYKRDNTTYTKQLARKAEPLRNFFYQNRGIIYTPSKENALDEKKSVRANTVRRNMGNVSTITPASTAIAITPTLDIKYLIVNTKTNMTQITDDLIYARGYRDALNNEGIKIKVYEAKEIKI